MRPAFIEDRSPGRYTPGRGAGMRQSAALAGSVLLNLLLLAGVVAAMRGPDLLAPDARSALVTVSITSSPRQAATPPPTPLTPSSGRPVLAATPSANATSPAPLVLSVNSGQVTATASPVQTTVEAGPSTASAPRSEPGRDEPPAADIDTYRQQLWQRILASRPRSVIGTGQVTIRFRIDHSGGLVSAEVAGSSGQFMLDRMALQTVRKAAPFPTPPAGMGDAALTFTVPVAFHR